tara:strand:- start:5141 stop:6349 length:1209 start_codon:yes stop_codon:yes gene_type:complete
MASDGTIATLIIIIFIVISLITILGFNLQHIKQNWKKYRCNPIIMPIAHFFNVDAKKNHQECAASLQSSFMDSLLAPLKSSQLSTIQNSQKTKASTDSTKSKANDSKLKLTGLMSGLFNKTNNVLIEFNRMGFSMSDIWNRMSGVFVLIHYMFETIINQISSTGNEISHLGKCFHPDTSLDTTSGAILIKHIEPGAILSNNNQVTSILQLDGSKEDIYKLDNTIVTGSHTVFYNNWIKVSQHPNAKLLSNYKLNTVYCLNTTNKTISLHNTRFRDWDEIDITDLKNKYPEYKNTSFKCENGLHKDTQIVLDNGSIKPISEITIGEKLLKTTVYGIVKIHAKEVDLYKQNQVISSQYALPAGRKIPIENNESYLYHLLTDSKYFWIKGHKLQLIRDYDSKIDD